MNLPENTKYGIGYDTTFELNEFGQIKNTILFVLFAKPGQYPSLPLIDMDISSLLYSNEALGTYFDKGIVDFMKTKYQDQPSLMIHIEGSESYPNGYMKDSIRTAD